MLRKLLAGLGLGALAAVIVLGLAASTDLLDRLELTTYDWRMRLAADPASVNKDIVLVEIDDASIREMAGRRSDRWPWPRVAIRSRDRFPAARAGEGRRRRLCCSPSATSGRVLRLRRPGRRRGAAQQSERALADSVKRVRQRGHARRRGLRRDRGRRPRRTPAPRSGSGRRFTPGRWPSRGRSCCRRYQELDRRRRRARPQLPRARRRRPGAADGAVHRQRRQGAAVARRRRGAAAPAASSPRTSGRTAASLRIGDRRVPLVDDAASAVPRPVDDADQLPRAGAGQECRGRAGDAVSVVRVPSSCSRAEQEILDRARSRGSIRRCSRTRSCSSA